jgi:hypothetical protein
MIKKMSNWPGKEEGDPSEILKLEWKFPSSDMVLSSYMLQPGVLWGIFKNDKGEMCRCRLTDGAMFVLQNSAVRVSTVGDPSGEITLMVSRQIQITEEPELPVDECIVDFKAVRDGKIVDMAAAYIGRDMAAWYTSPPENNRGLTQRESSLEIIGTPRNKRAA